MLVKIKYFYTILFILFCLCQSKKCFVKVKKNKKNIDQSTQENEYPTGENSNIKTYTEDKDITVDSNDIRDDKFTEVEIEISETTENVENILSTIKPITITSKYSTDETSSSLFTIASDITSLDPSTTSVLITSTAISTPTVTSDITSLDPSTTLESISSSTEISSHTTTTNLIISDILPTSTPAVQDNNYDNLGLSYFVVSFNVTFSEKHKKLLNSLNKKYPEYFTVEEYKKTKCDENCLLQELALIEISNEIRDIIADNTDKMNQVQLKDFKEYDRKERFNNLPLEHSILYNRLATVTNRYNGKGEIIYVLANDDIIKIIKEYYKSKITSIEKYVSPLASTTSSNITPTLVTSDILPDEDGEEMEIPSSWFIDL